MPSKMNKRADLSDPILIIIMLFFLAISFIVCSFVYLKFADVITGTELNDTDQAAAIVDRLTDISENSLQRAFIMVLGFLVIGTIVSSFMVRVHPVFIFLWIIFGGMSIFIAIVIANAYGIFAQTAVLNSVIVQQTMITYVFKHLVEITLGIVGITMVVLFSKLPSTGGGSGGI